MSLDVKFRPEFLQIFRNDIRSLAYSDIYAYFITMVIPYLYFLLDVVLVLVEINIAYHIHLYVQSITHCTKHPSKSSLNISNLNIENLESGVAVFICCRI